MKIFRKSRVRGITILEIVLSLTITAILFISVLSMWYFAQRSWARERVITKLRVNLEIAMERIKKEARLSSATYMSLYKPSGESEYTAISFPLPTPDPAASGFFTLDSENNIYWDTSVIYYVYDNDVSGKTELKRHEITGNHDTLTDEALRVTQLEDVIDDGDGETVFESLVDLTINPKALGYDCYSSTLERSNNVEFGSIKLEAGDHLFRFEVTGQNDDSDGYTFGIDSISVSPSGCQKEAEACAISASSGESASTIYVPTGEWGGDNFLEFNAAGEGSYITFTLKYDSWLESNFKYCTRDNAVISPTSLVLKLATPKEGMETCWQATEQTADEDSETVTETFASATGITIRNILSADNLDMLVGQKLIRIKFVNKTEESLTIDKVYLAERTGGDDALAGIQLFFSDSPVLVGEEETDGDTIGGTSGVTPASVSLEPGYYVWSNWADVELLADTDYFVTFYISAISADVSSWSDPVGSEVHSYWWFGDHADETTWQGYLAGEWDDTNKIYAVEVAANWKSTGIVTSQIYDTKLTNPSYNDVSWNFSLPSDTSITMQARASSNSDMSGATSWVEVFNGGSLPGGMDDKRYVQFRTTFVTANYSNYPWIDNVEIDWDGETRMCDISAYFAKDSDYGIVKLTVDGEDLTKGLIFGMTISEAFQEQTLNASLTAEVEPRNTGR